MTYRLFDSCDDYIVQHALIVDVCNLKGLCNQVVGILLGSHVARLHVLQNGCVIFGDGLVGCVFFQKIIYNFWV